MKGLEFGNLPLVEVSVRLFFSEALPLTLGLAHKAAGVLEERFPELDDVDVLEPSAVRVEVPPTVTLFGARFHGGQSGISLTLQADLLSVRWQRNFGPRSPKYPRFPKLQEDLAWAEKRLSGVFENGLPPTKAASVVYTSFVPSSDDSAEGTLGRYFAESAWINLVKGSSIFHDLNVSWRESDGIDRRFFLRREVAGADGTRGFVVGTVAGAEVSAGSSSHARVESLHDCLQGFFKSLISDTAKKEWDYAE